MLSASIGFTSTSILSVSSLCVAVIVAVPSLFAVISPSKETEIMLYRWIDKYKTYGDAAFAGKGNLKPEEAKMKRLQ